MKPSCPVVAMLLLSLAGACCFPAVARECSSDAIALHSAAQNGLILQDFSKIQEQLAAGLEKTGIKCTRKNGGEWKCDEIAGSQCGSGDGSIEGARKAADVRVMQFSIQMALLLDKDFSKIRQSLLDLMFKTHYECKESPLSATASAWICRETP